VLGAVERLSRVPLSRAAEPTWYSLFGYVLPGAVLYVMGLASLAPSLARLGRSKGLAWTLLCAHALAFLYLLWRAPLPALFCYLAPNIVVPFVKDRRSLLSLLPALALIALGSAAALRHAGPAGPLVSGLWPQVWELLIAAAGLVALWFARPGPPGPVWKKAAAPRKKRASR
jgi:hypothetical protein